MIKTTVPYRLLFHGSVLATEVCFRIIQQRDPRLQKAMQSFQAVYNFRYGSAHRQLVFDNGTLRTYQELSRRPDLEVTFLDMDGVIKKTREDPGNVLILMIENLICVKGNTYYLFKLGYLFSICELYLRDKIRALSSLVQQR